MLDMVVFGKRLKNIMNDKKINVAELSGKTNISESALRYYIRGEKTPSLTHVIDIAKILNIKISDLVEEEWIKEDKNSYIDTILKKHGMVTPYIDMNGLSEERLMKFEEDLVTFIKFLTEREKRGR